MEYESPKAADFDEVRALNLAFLRAISRYRNAAGLLSGVSPEIAARLRSLGAAESRRLATTPFLLFTLRESDEGYWAQVHGERALNDLFDPGAGIDPDIVRLVDAALGYAWQMARRNPYTLRLVACASLYWCEQLAEARIVEILHRAASIGNVIELRAADNALLWERLLSGGIDERPDIRLATHQAALQTLLIRPNVRSGRRLRSAACKTRIPALTISRED